MPVSARKSQLLQQLGSTAKSGGKVDVSTYHKTATATQVTPPVQDTPTTLVTPPTQGTQAIPAPTVDTPVAEASVTEAQTPQQESEQPQLEQNPQESAQEQPIQEPQIELSEEDEKLADFEAAIAEAVPATILANTPDPLNPSQPTTALKKELAPEAVMAQQPLSPEPVALAEVAADSIEPQVTETQQLQEVVNEPDKPAAMEQVTTPEQGVAGMQVLEHEPKPEISPEVSEYLKEVETHQELQPHEVVVANQVPQVLPPKMLPKPVIVLPITPEIEDVGSKKGVMWSIRWLVEWSQKIMKMFSGKVIYKEVKAEA
jgi:hypothetical protein